MMDSNTSAKQRQDLFNLRQVAIILAQSINRIAEHRRHHLLLIICVKLKLAHLQSESLTLSLAECKHNHRIVLLEHDHFDDLVDVRWTRRTAALL